ncbi:hypothetical protein SAPIO_CDS0419 [Scedosporium apiospermum]|uniref:Uncharacterized protein n=1 Tax=Pseudallescheria apiosperma TaxID=563466 RepID=A0A084GGZ1_PSEDA|nr:uncharacterized protein SAPIO_CDS0419 [Scedosporium apiospermum]KEZ46603.1 hypothetical protein SAPIO_CDS0419 [Scedosporium apiospermum]
MLAQTAVVLYALLTKSFVSASAFSLQGRSRTETALAALAELTVDDGISMKWTRSIYPGEEPVDLYGDAKDIYEAIRVVNPILGQKLCPQSGRLTLVWTPRLVYSNGRVQLVAWSWPLAVKLTQAMLRNISVPSRAIVVLRTENAAV